MAVVVSSAFQISPASLASTPCCRAQSAKCHFPSICVDYLADLNLSARVVMLVTGEIIETKIIGQYEDDIRWVWLLPKSTGA